MDLILLESPQYYSSDADDAWARLGPVADRARREGTPIRVPEGDVVTYAAWGPPYPTRCEVLAGVFEGCDYAPYRGEPLRGLEVLVLGGLFQLERRQYRYYLGRLAGRHGLEASQLQNFHPGAEFAFVHGEVADRVFECVHEAAHLRVDGSASCPRDELQGTYEPHAYGWLRGDIGYLIVRRIGEEPAPPVEAPRPA